MSPTTGLILDFIIYSTNITPLTRLKKLPEVLYICRIDFYCFSTTICSMSYISPLNIPKCPETPALYFP